MKVIHIITGLNDGGAESVLQRICIYDVANTHSVVSLMDLGKHGPILQDAGILVYSLNLKRGCISLKSLWRLWYILWHERPDVVQTWMYHADLLGGLVARLVGISNVVWNIRHSELDHGKSSRTTIFIAHLNSLLSHFLPRKIVVCANHAAIVHESLGFDAKRMVIINNGYDLSRLFHNRNKRMQVRHQWGITKKQIVIGFVARFNPQKDHQNLFTAIRLLQERGLIFKTILAGHDISNDNVELRKMCVGINDIIMLGPQNDVPGVMSAIDIHVMSSCSEGFPNVLAEAMACGTPCVTTDVGDASQIVGDTGWVVPSGNSEALSEAIAIACHERFTQPEAWKKRQKAARQRIDLNFSIKKMVDAYIDVWQS